MKRSSKWYGGFVALALVLCCACSMVAVAEDAAYFPQTGRLEVRGQAIRTVTPDTVEFTIGATAQSKSEQEALSDANAIIADVIASLTALNVPENQIRTSRLDISPRYETVFSKRQLVGYTASVSLTVKLTEFDMINTAIDTAVAHGANNIGGMRFSFSEEGLAYRQALSDAITAAREKAQSMAEAAGVQLGTLLYMREGSYNTYPYANAYFAEAESSAPDTYAGTQVMSGEIQINASVDMTYETK